MNPEINSLTKWIQSKIDTERYGEVHITVKIHDGKPSLLERSFIEKIQLSGQAGGKYEHTNRN